MADIHATSFRYDCMCTELQKTPHPYILKMFEKEKEDTVLESKDNMNLYLAGNNKLLTYVRIGDDDCHVLWKTLMNNIYVVSVDLRYNKIGDEGAKHIGKLIQDNCSLRAINLMFNDIGDEGAGHLAEGLQSNESLQSLRMTGNKIGNKGGMYFAQALQVNSSLEDLDLGDTDQKIESVIALCSVLHQNESIKSLNVNRPLFFTHQEETTVHFLKLLKANTSLQDLHLRKHDMRDFGMTRLSEGLINNFTLTHLNLSSNRITRDGAKELAKVLKNDTSLVSVDLGYNRLENEGAQYLAEALATYNTTLRCLVLSYNNIKGPGLCAVADSLKQNTSLINIYIWGNDLEESACIAFASLINSGRLNKEDTDVTHYVVDGRTHLGELNTHPSRHYYWAPSYGDDVPEWQIRGKGECVKESNMVAMIERDLIGAC